MLSKDKLPAMGLWILCASWVAGHVTDGYVPREVVKRFDPKCRYAKCLVAAGMWVEAVRDGVAGYQFHDWHEYQLTSTDLAKRRESGRTGGLKSARLRRAKREAGQANA
jgi:hypothetical protein